MSSVFPNERLNAGDAIDADLRCKPGEDVDHVAPTADPYLRASTPLSNRIGRAAWGFVYLCLYRPSPRPLHAWRSFLLRAFGAKLGPNCHFYPRARIWAPWNLVCEDSVGVADDVEIYNPAVVTLKSHSVVSQGAYLCGASHDHDDPSFPMIWAPISVGRYAWIGARAVVLMGLTIGDGAILGLGSIATRNLEPWSINAGIPARNVGERRRHASVQSAQRRRR